MPAGEIQRKGAPAPKVTLGLGSVLGAKAAGITDINAVLQFMMDTAVETKAITAQYLEAADQGRAEMVEIRRILYWLAAERASTHNGDTASDTFALISVPDPD